MAEQRRIPEVERLESRDTPSVPVSYLAPPIHLSATHGSVAPQFGVLTPTIQAAAGESQATRDIPTPIETGEHALSLTTVCQQSADVVFSGLAEPWCDSASTAWTQPLALEVGPSINGGGAAHARDAGDTVATDVPPSQQQAPTIEGVLRYASKSVGRHRVDDAGDAVQQVCLEWLLLAATMATTYDDVRRIVARVIDRAYRRLQKQQRTLQLLDVADRADAIQESFRDMQLDRDLGVKDLTDREWQVVGLRRQGYTFAEVGLIVGMRRQRAREMFEVAASYLRNRYHE